MLFRSLLRSVFLAVTLVPVANAQLSVVPPDEWSRRLLERCLDERQQDELLLSQLKDEASANATATEDLLFPAKEEAGRAKTLSIERKRYLARASFFLIGDKERLQESLVPLFGDATACQLEALQATLLYAY